MKNKAGMWSILAIGAAVGLAILTGFGYYGRKYEDQFASIKAMDSKMKLRQIRQFVENNELHHWRLYESDKPLWYYCDESHKVNPTSTSVISQIRKDAVAGRKTYFFAKFNGPKTSTGITAQIFGGTLRPGRYLETRFFYFFPTQIIKYDNSKSILFVSTSEPVDPFEKILAACGFYR